MKKLQIRETILESMQLNLRSIVLENIALVETYLRNPEHYDDITDRVCLCLDEIALNEERYTTLHKYFIEKPPAVAAPDQKVSMPNPYPASPTQETIKGAELSKRSPTYKKSVTTPSKSKKKGKKNDE